MKLEKIIVDNIERCYSVNFSEIDNKECLMVASEKIDGEFSYYPIDDLNNKQTIWNDIGGTMSIIKVPNTENTFYVGTKFYPGFNSIESGIMCVKKVGDVWQKTEVLKVSYLHRFDIFNIEDKRIFVGCTLCTSKKDKEDWSDPGKVLIGELNQDVTKPFEVSVLKDNMLKNHGYWRGQYLGKQAGYIACDSGIYVFIPSYNLADCKLEKILDGTISEMAVYDFDGCGNDEIVTIEPFHGNKVNIYKLQNNKYECIYNFPYEVEFAHALWAGKLANESTIILGTRKLDKKMYSIIYRNNEYVVEEQDAGNGSANVSVFTSNGKEYILSANNAIGEVALYKVL